MREGLMITEDNVRRIFKGLEEGDGASFFEHVADKVDWIVEGTHPLAGHYKSKSDFLAGTFAKLAKVLPSPFAKSAIFSILDLHKIHPFDPAEVVSIEADVVQDTYDFTGGGRFGPKINVHTKEDADHSLPYLLAVALFDGDVQPAQLTPERIAKPDVQSLLLKVRVRPDKSFTARYPAEFPSRVTVRLKSGQSLSHEVSDYPGF